jgi:hypothetical protein
MSEVVQSMDRDRLHQEASDLYFDILATTGKPPRLGVLIKELSARHEFENAIVKSLLTDPTFDAMLISRRKRRIIEQAALKVTAAEYAERIASLGLAELVDRMEADPGSLKTKELIEAVKLASDLNAKVDQDIEAVTGSGDVNINIRFKELLLNVPPERRAALMGEAVRRMSAPGEVIDAQATEG